jgi:hypothetical protein
MWGADSEIRERGRKKASQLEYARQLEEQIHAKHSSGAASKSRGPAYGSDFPDPRPLEAGRPPALALASHAHASDVLDREAARVSVSKQQSYLDDLKSQIEARRAVAEREQHEERLRSARAEAEAQASNNFWGNRAAVGGSQLRDAAGHVLAPRRYAR